MGGGKTESQVAAIMNAAWMVRHYARGGRTKIQAQERDKAIKHLGVTVRDALNTSSDFEPLLIALVDGLHPREEPPF